MVQVGKKNETDSKHDFRNCYKLNVFPFSFIIKIKFQLLQIELVIWLQLTIAQKKV